MENLLKSPSLIQRAYWLIRLRWVAIATLAIATFVSHRYMHVSLATSALYVLAAVLVIYNAALYSLLTYWTRASKSPTLIRPVEWIVTFQISADLLILTTILHFSGGIENPFSFFFVFQAFHDPFVF